jgi:hypothetical protein
MVTFKVKLRLIAVKFSRTAVIACYTPAFALQLTEKARQNFSQGCRKVPVGQESMWQYGRLLRVARTSCRSRSPCSMGPGLTLGQRRNRSSCVNKAFSTSANFESNLSVKDMMWSAKNVTPKSSWICVLPLYKVHYLAMQRHLDWSTCSFLTGVRAADLQMWSA